MREIKFRALDVSSKRMIRPDQICRLHFKDGETCCVFLWDSDLILDYELMQYTGRHDNTKWEQISGKEQEAWLKQGKTKEQWNGKEIYEGDIVKPRGGNALYVVYYDERACQYRLCANDDRQFDKTHVLDFAEQVIGNIHENPELMEEEQENGRMRLL
jgi:hypothetical protein